MPRGVCVCVSLEAFGVLTGSLPSNPTPPPRQEMIPTEIPVEAKAD